MTLGAHILHRFCQPKLGHSEEECEDVFAVNEAQTAFALCDGASQCIYARQWAEMLSKAVLEIDGIPNEQALANVRKRFFSSLPLDNLPWNLLSKVQHGSFATLLSVQFDILPYCHLQIHSIGDSCLGYLDQGEEHFFPQTSADEFGNHPELVSSLGSLNSVLSIRTLELQKLPQMLFMMTDSLAAWCLRNRDELPLRQLKVKLDLGHDVFSAWLSDQIAATQIKNDDITVVVIEIKETEHGEA